MLSTSLFLTDCASFCVGTVIKSYDAADFSEINELADDEETNYRRGLSFVSRNVKGTVAKLLSKLMCWTLI